MSLSQNTKTRIVEALTAVKQGNELIGAVGVYGAFRVNADATVQSSTGDIVAIPDSGGAAGTYRVLMPSINSQIQSIDWIDVGGFTPRAPTGVETVSARVCGFNFDVTLKQWYITVQLVLLSSGAVDATPPAGFTTGVRVAVTLLPTANRP